MAEIESKFPQILYTEAYCEYAEHQLMLAKFQAFIWKLIVAIDEPKVKNAVSMLQRSQSEFVSVYEFLQTDTQSVGAEMREYGNWFAQMILCDAVNSCLVYITALLALIFETKPEMLKSKQMVSTEFIIDHLATNDLIPALVERRVTELSYKGMRDLSDYTEKKLGFPLFIEEDALSEAVRIVDIRNTIVHNRGKVNNHLIQRNSEFKDKLGKEIIITADNVHRMCGFLLDAAENIDRRAIQTFSIQKAIRPSLINRVPEKMP